MGKCATKLITIHEELIKTSQIDDLLLPGSPVGQKQENPVAVNEELDIASFFIGDDVPKKPVGGFSEFFSVLQSEIREIDDELCDEVSSRILRVLARREHKTAREFAEDNEAWLPSCDFSGLEESAVNVC
jgi:hypothetical protein